MNIRITTALHYLLRKTAAHRKMDVSEVIRRAANGIRNNRPVVHFELPEVYHEKPDTVLKVRGLVMPDISLKCYRRSDILCSKTYRGLKWLIVRAAGNRYRRK